jgi:S-methylmethionine-dependent homocysteine/selenocysteine methylase
MSYAALRDRLDRGELLVLDGGVGSELIRRGVYWRGNGLERDADVVRALHAEYLAAGADVITANTFHLTRRTYLTVFADLEHMRRIGAPGLETRAADLARRAVALARQAREGAGRDAAIAGSVSPLAHPFRPDLAPPPRQARAEHEETIAVLAEAGADLVLLESMNTAAEARAALEAARAVGLPAWVSFVPRWDGRLVSGEVVADAVAAVAPFDPDVILFNCAPPDDITQALGEVIPHWRGPTGGYAHIGHYDPPSWKLTFFPRFTGTEAWPPSRYAAAALDWVALGAQVVGGCCGTGPEHIRALREALSPQPIFVEPGTGNREPGTKS